MMTRSSDRSSRRLFPSIALGALGLALGAGACKGDTPPASSESKAGPNAAGDSANAGADEVEPADAERPLHTAADSISAAPSLRRGAVLGHVMLPDPAKLMGKIKRQAAPPAAGMFLDPEFIKNVGAMQLGERGDVIRNLELDKPLGCVLVDTTATEVPVACTVGYLGGAEALVSDLGAEGKQADAEGTKGHFVFEGQHLYIDDLDKAVVVANHPEALTKAKPYLKRNILARADQNVSDVEAVAYVSAAMERYGADLEPFLTSVGAPPLPTSANPMQRALAEYALGTNKDNVQRFKQTEQFTVGLGFDDAGFTARWAMFATAGSELETELKSISAGPVDLAFVGKLPANAAMLTGMRFDGELGEMKSMQELRNVMVAEYCTELGKDPAAVNTAIDAFFAEENALYGQDLAAAIVHRSGSLAAVVLEAPLRTGKSGRDGWKTWAESFAAADVLGEDAAKKVSWSFKPDAATIAGIAIDRWSIKLTASALAELEKESPEALKRMKAKWPSLTVTIDRAEVDGRAIFILSGNGGADYMQEAIAATNGKNTVGATEGFKTITARDSKVSAVTALDVKRGTDIVRMFLDAEQAAKVPAEFGTNLADVFFVNSYGQTGQQTGEFAVAQPFLDHLRALAN